MLLQNKTAIVYGGGGAIGGAVARAFAREGAKVFLAGRSIAQLDHVAKDIGAAGGCAEVTKLDALDETAVNKHADRVAAKTGHIDVALNAVGIRHVQGTPLTELSFEDFAHPITSYTRTNFLTARAVARHMVKQGSGVILTMSTPESQGRVPGFLGHAVACGAVETFSRILAGELGPSGIRVICLRPAITAADAMRSERARTSPLLGRCPTLADVANYTAFVASDGAGAMTGAIANLTCGSLVD